MIQGNEPVMNDEPIINNESVIDNDYDYEDIENEGEFHSQHDEKNNV